MAKGFSGMPGNMNNLMRQAQKMQKQMEELQTEMENKVYEITSGGGAVKVTITGKKELTGLVIDPSAVDPEDVEMLQDLILSAVNEAMRTAEEDMNNQMGKITGGMSLPGGLF